MLKPRCEGFKGDMGKLIELQLNFYNGKVM
jgi:hypothetical protein